MGKKHKKTRQLRIVCRNTRKSVVDTLKAIEELEGAGVLGRIRAEERGLDGREYSVIEDPYTHAKYTHPVTGESVISRLTTDELHVASTAASIFAKGGINLKQAYKVYCGCCQDYLSHIYPDVVEVALIDIRNMIDFVVEVPSIAALKEPDSKVQTVFSWYTKVLDKVLLIHEKESSR